MTGASDEAHSNEVAAGAPSINALAGALAILQSMGSAERHGKIMPMAWSNFCEWNLTD